MKIEQSRRQYFIERLCTEGAILICTLIGVSLYLILSESEKSYHFIYYAIGVPAIIALWLTVFNSGSSKIVENGVEINSKGFSYIRFGSKQTIGWEQYDGFKVTNGLFKSIYIKNKSGADIVFSYYTFSSAQRKIILDKLG